MNVYDWDLYNIAHTNPPTEYKKNKNRDELPNNTGFFDTIEVYTPDDKLVSFDRKEPRDCNVIKICGGKPIYIYSTSWKFDGQHNINYYIPRIWFANPAVVYNETELENTYKKDYNNQQSFKDVFFRHMCVYMNYVTWFIKELCESNISSVKEITEKISEMPVIYDDNLCSTGFIIHKNEIPPAVYNGYYVYRINNFLRDYDHSNLYDFIIISPYSIFGGNKLYDHKHGTCISVNYLYGVMFLQTETANIDKNLKYTVNYKFLVKSSNDISGYIIENNDYNLRVEDIHVDPPVVIKKTEEISGFSYFDGGSIQKTSTMWILLIALIILLIFMYLNSVNKYFSRRVASNRISARHCTAYTH